MHLLITGFMRANDPLVYYIGDTVAIEFTQKYHWDRSLLTSWVALSTGELSYLFSRFIRRWQGQTRRSRSHLSSTEQPWQNTARGPAQAYSLPGYCSQVGVHSLLTDHIHRVSVQDSHCFKLNMHTHTHTRHRLRMHWLFRAGSWCLVNLKINLNLIPPLGLLWSLAHTHLIAFFESDFLTLLWFKTLRPDLRLQRGGRVSFGILCEY